MSVDVFVPEFWSARLRRFLDPRLVLAQPTVMNRDWEGEIRDAGDTVHINRPGAGGTIRTYTRNTPMAPPDRPDGETLTLVVDQQKAFYIAVDNVDEAQANIRLMDGFAQRTARNLAVTLDSFAAAKFVAAAIPANRIGTDATPVTIKADGTGDFTPYQFAVEARKRLQKQSTPGDDRWMVINADLEAQFLLDPQYIETANREVTRSGQIGSVAGFDILTTEALPASPGSGGAPVPNHKVVYGDGNYALTWADQVVKTAAEDLQGEFGDAVKGLNVFGAKVIEPESYGIADVANPA
ncbi:hypothetical protein PAI11_37490 [Patulibacter medicamentivorans]|uniref:Major capsid protein n=1 Tax=Patulibacter medicamentivorans TaxID=1097667 RepID=H0EA75_9ACTN|nr:P22 phage major capsid protein family protein [Patulibacter medicamentivorans]EHN09415.1 hypothetical protein PAI11_37490 [Patulibacter medicamentivorans]